MRMPRLLELLMRRYTGLFSYPVPIDENYIASQTGVQVPVLRQLLYQLSLQHVIRYVPFDHATVIYLHHERLRPKNVNLDPQRYELLKKAALGRMEKMVDYISEDGVCRSRYLLEYFGQTESSDCGTCDICRSRKSRMAVSEEHETLMASFIRDEMSGSYAIEDVLRRFSSPGPLSHEECLEILRRLIEEGQVLPPARY